MKKLAAFAVVLALGAIYNATHPTNTPFLKEVKAAPGSQYAADRAFCSEWSDFCRANGRVTPEMLKR